MQIVLISLILSFILLAFVLIFRRKSEGIFSPLIIALGFIFITNVPYIISIASDYNILYGEVQSRIPETEIAVAIFKYTAVLAIGVFGLVLGINSKISKSIGNKIPVIMSNENKSRYRVAIVFAFTIGLCGYVLFFNSAGGLSNWLNNLSMRASFTTGNGYLTTMMGLTQIAVYIYICTFKYKKSRLKFAILFLLVIGVSLLSSSLGGRKDTLQFIIFCFLVWNFAVMKIKRVSVKLWLLVPFFIFYILAVPILRSTDGIDKFLNNPEMLIEEVKNDLNTTTKQFSYIDHQLFIMDYFTIDKLWFGKSYVDLLYAPLPSSIYPDKPPIDDGTYIRTLAEGYEVEPSTPYSQLYQSSWPPETFGAMYMNFSVIGVFIGMYLLGIIYNASFVYMKKSNYTIISILIYGNIVLNFHLSNLRIVQTITEIVLVTLFLGIFFWGKQRKNIHIRNTLRGW